MDNYEDVAREIVSNLIFDYDLNDISKVEKVLKATADEARRELIDKLISVGEACNGMVSVPVLKAWKIEFTDIDLNGWGNLEGPGDKGDK